MRTPSMWRRVRLAVALVSLVLTGLAGSLAAGSAAGAQWPAPPNGVYTCDWIAAHQAAALAAHVTCDPAVFFSALSTSPSADAFLPMDSGQERIPLNTNQWVGQGVFAWQPNYHSATRWAGYALKRYDSDTVDYTWHVQRSDGYNYTSGRKFDTSTWGPLNVASGASYRAGFQNHSADAVAMEAFWGP